MTYYLAFVLQADQYGEFTLTQAAFSFSLYAAGLDFYLFSNRYILKNIKSQAKASAAIFSQFFVNAIGVIVISVPFYIYMKGSGFDFIIILVLLGSILTDCLAQEITRILEIIGAQRRVSIVNAIRFGVGSLFLIVIVQYNITNNADFSAVLSIMYLSLMMTSFLAFLYGLKSVSNHVGIVFSFPKFYLIKSGIGNIPKYIIGTLSYRGLFSFDKFIIGAFCTKTSLSWYGFICLTLSGIQLVQDTIISAYLYPKIMRYGIQHKHAEMYCESRRMANMNAASGVLLGAAAVIFFYFLENRMLVAKLAIENLEVAIILIICYTLNATSMPYHYVLYAKNKLSTISVVHVCSLIVFIMLCSIHIIYAITPFSISICLLLSFLVLFVLRLKLARMACHD
ncbi:hypothetical protein [Chromobacterium piscinae]|uniref:hypothetical protein n=1 Tax=Chromobacterium piscinae TaxID=686831 RepID=UPI00320B8517